MSKPEDVTDEAWEEVRELLTAPTRELGCWDVWAISPDGFAEKIMALTARAIMAAEKRGEEREREACAQQVNDRAEEFRAAKTVTANTMGRIFDDLAATIRARSA